MPRRLARRLFMPTCLIALLLLAGMCNAQTPSTVAASTSTPPRLDYINATSIWCSSGAELAAGFANPDVTLIIIDVDWIVITEQDYAPFVTPILLTRNITVWGARESPERYPILDFQYIKAKISLGRGVYLDFSRFVTERVREPANFQAPGTDLIADDFSRNMSDPSALGVVRWFTGITLHRTCFDNNASVMSIGTLPRPRFIPGRQAGHVVDLPGPAPNCTASSAPFVPLSQRCLVGSSGFYTELALYALSLDTTSKSVPSGNVIYIKDFMWRCYSIMAPDCVAARGLVGCFYAMYPLGSFVPAFNTSVDIRNASTYSSALLGSSASLAPPRASSPPPPPSQQQQQPVVGSGGGNGSSSSSDGAAAVAAGDQQGGGGSSSSVLAPVLAGVLGGLAVLAAAAAAVWFFVMRRGRGRQSSGLGGKRDLDDAAGASSGCGGSFQKPSAGAKGAKGAAASAAADGKERPSADSGDSGASAMSPDDRNNNNNMNYCGHCDDKPECANSNSNAAAVAAHAAAAAAASGGGRASSRGATAPAAAAAAMDALLATDHPSLSQQEQQQQPQHGIQQPGGNGVDGDPWPYGGLHFSAAAAAAVPGVRIRQPSDSNGGGGGGGGGAAGARSDVQQQHAPVWTERSPLQAGIPLHVRVTEFADISTGDYPLASPSPRPPRPPGSAAASPGLPQPPPPQKGSPGQQRVRTGAALGDSYEPPAHAADDAAAAAAAADAANSGGRSSSFGTAAGSITDTALTTATSGGNCRTGSQLSLSAAAAAAAADAAAGVVTLLPTVIGVGGFGRVVEGLFRGERVAVKLINTGLLMHMAAAAVAPAEPQRPLQQQQQQQQPAPEPWEGVVAEATAEADTAAAGAGASAAAATGAAAAAPEQGGGGLQQGAQQQQGRRAHSTVGSAKDLLSLAHHSPLTAPSPTTAAQSTGAAAVEMSRLFSSTPRPAAAAVTHAGGAATATSGPGTAADGAGGGGPIGRQLLLQPLQPLRGDVLSTNYDDWQQHLLQPPAGLHVLMLPDNLAPAAAAAAPAAAAAAAAGMGAGGGGAHGAAADGNPLQRRVQLSASTNKSTTTTADGIETDLKGIGSSALLPSSGAGLPPATMYGSEHDSTTAARAAVQQAQRLDPGLYGGDRMAAALSAALAQEVAVLARVRHPNIVRLLAANLTPPIICLVLERMDTNLERVLYGGGGDGLGASDSGEEPRQPPLSLRKAVGIALQVANALACLHPTILHRDLKPANVLISGADTDAPVAKLADFGLSRLRDTVLVTQNPEVGTVPYMAPETFNLENHTNSTIRDRSDCYAFGVLLWELITGLKPWKGCQLVQIAYQVTVLRRRLPLEPLDAAGAPHKLTKLIVGCWEEDPLRRPAAAEIVKELLLVQEALDVGRPSGGRAGGSAAAAAAAAGATSRRRC